MIHETKLKVRYGETDQMGIVHHSNYYHWFEAARTELYNSLGLPYGEVEKQGVFIPLIETHCYYKAPALYEDELVIRTKFEGMKGVRAYFTYEVIRESDGKLLATGRTGHTFTTPDMKPINIKKENPKLYELLMSCAE